MSKLYKCTVCNSKKQVNEFYLRDNGKVCEYKCKTCIKDRRSDYSSSNYAKVRECNRKAVSKFQKKYPEKNAVKVSNYRCRKNNSMPKWLSQSDVSKIKSIYKICRMLSKKTGVRHEVDHIVPINGVSVTGLHVPWNLQILTKDENLRKSNKLIEDIVYS